MGGLIYGMESGEPNMSTVRWLHGTVANAQQEMKQQALSDLLNPLNWLAVRQKMMDLCEEHWSDYEPNEVPSSHECQYVMEADFTKFTIFLSKPRNFGWRQKYEEAT